VHDVTESLIKATLQKQTTTEPYKLRDNLLSNISVYVRFEVFTAVAMKNAVFWDVTPCSSYKSHTV
jgi:hypothetical protein